MDRLIYSRGRDDTKECFKIEFDIPEGLTIGELKVIFIRLASALGYSEETIKDEFGPLTDPMRKLNIEKILLHG